MGGGGAFSGLPLPFLALPERTGRIHASAAGEEGTADIRRLSPPPPPPPKASEAREPLSVKGEERPLKANEAPEPRRASFGDACGGGDKQRGVFRGCARDHPT